MKKVKKAQQGAQMKSDSTKLIKGSIPKGLKVDRNKTIKEYNKIFSDTAGVKKISNTKFASGGSLSPSKSNTSNRLASYNNTKRAIGMNKTGRVSKKK